MEKLLRRSSPIDHWPHHALPIRGAVAMLCRNNHKILSGEENICSSQFPLLTILYGPRIHWINADTKICDFPIHCSAIERWACVRPKKENTSTRECQVDWSGISVDLDPNYVRVCRTDEGGKKGRENNKTKSIVGKKIEKTLRMR